MKNILFFGYGYVVDRFCKTSQVKFDNKYVISRSEVNHTSIKWQNINKFSNCEKITHLLISIPPCADEKKISNQLRGLDLSNLEWCGYLSATSVYGDYKGDWVNENSALRSNTESGKERISSEVLWKEILPEVNILRLAGIYGPKRSAVERVLNGGARRIIKEGHFFSRIHVDDIVQAIDKLIFSLIHKQIFNLADDLPASQHEVIDYVCKLIDCVQPETILFNSGNISKKMLDFYSENKKVSNLKLKTKLDLDLKYPTYKQGLEAIWKEFYYDRKT
ncbi:MAG: SDR family NAD(P)-dependent oxidoreductase [Rickettsiales bacterium]